MPLGVDSTACLVEAQLRDRAASAAARSGAPRSAPSAVGSSESELRLQYAMAVVRMVNGIADSAQRGRVAASVASLASAAGAQNGARGTQGQRAGSGCCFTPPWHAVLCCLFLIRQRQGPSWLAEPPPELPAAPPAAATAAARRAAPHPGGPSARGHPQRAAFPGSVAVRAGRHPAGRQAEAELPLSPPSLLALPPAPLPLLRTGGNLVWQPHIRPLWPCRLAAQHGLAWLQGNYWQRQSDHVHASTDRVRALVQVRQRGAK